MGLPIGALHGNPRHNRNLGNLEKAFGHVLVHADGGTEHASAYKGQASEIEQTLNRAIFTVSAMHHGKDNLEASSTGAESAHHHCSPVAVRGHPLPLY